MRLARRILGSSKDSEFPVVPELISRPQELLAHVGVFQLISR
jgi:hypothetical protein